MPAKVKVRSNLKGLDQLQKNLKTKLVAKLGVFASDNARDDDEGLTNADIGAIHEFGVISEDLNIPRRSFLRDPIEIKRKELLAVANKAIKANISEKGGARKVFELVGIAAEAVVQEAFETGGFGTWAPILPATAKAKSRKQNFTSLAQLIDTSQLRKSVISKVEKGE